MFRQIKNFCAYIYIDTFPDKNVRLVKEIFAGMAFYHVEFKTKNIFTHLTIKICPS
jgi:hypothetical protein